MNKAVKIALIAAFVLLVSGLITALVGMYLIDFDFTQMGTEQMVTNTHTVADSFRNICIDTDVANVFLLPAENNVCAVICHEPEAAQHTVAVQNGTLLIKSTDTRTWYERIGIFTAEASITVYLPMKEYGRIEAEADTAKIQVNSAFTFESAEIETDTGHISWEADVKQNLSLNTDTGAIYISAKSVGGTINAETDTGKIQLMSVRCKNVIAEASTGAVILTNTVAEERFDIETSTGGVELDRADAGKIRIKTGTGGIRGTLLTEKIFITETSTGRINVPASTAGGRCEISTSTGNIDLRIAE